MAKILSETLNRRTGAKNKLLMIVWRMEEENGIGKAVKPFMIQIGSAFKEHKFCNHK